MFVLRTRKESTKVLQSAAAAFFAGALIFVTGCGGGKTAPVVTPGPGTVVTPTSSAVQGTSQQTYVTSGGTVSQPQDLTKVYIAAKVPGGPGSWTTIEANTKSDGTFEIAGVPTGKYWLLTPQGAYWTNATSLDLGSDVLGRPGSSVPQRATYLDIQLNGLKPWTDGDAIQILNPNLGQTFRYDWPDFSVPDVGETSTETVKAWTGPLSIASQGDAWYASQLLNTTVGGVSFRTLGRATPALGVTQQDGGTTQLDGSLSNAPTSTVHLKVLGSQFAGIASVVNPGAQLHVTKLGVYIQPFTSSKGEIGNAPTLVERADQNPITTDVDFGDISYGNPFPSQWTPFVSLSYEFLVDYQAAGASSGVTVPAEISSSSTQLPTLSSPLLLPISPVRNAKLNGNSVSQPQSGIGLTPTLTWDAPATGTVSGYRVTVYQLSKSGNSSAYRNVIDLYTNENTLAVPDGILVSGQQYFFAVRAFSVPGVDFTKNPNRLAFPWAYADLLTSVVSTQ